MTKHLLLDSEPKRTKRVTRSVKESGLIGGMHLEVLTALRENGAMCYRQVAAYLDWPAGKCGTKLSDLVRHGLAEKTGQFNEGRTIYAAKERASDEKD